MAPNCRAFTYDRLAWDPVLKFHNGRCLVYEWRQWQALCRPCNNICCCSLHCGSKWRSSYGVAPPYIPSKHVQMRQCMEWLFRPAQSGQVHFEEPVNLVCTNVLHVRSHCPEIWRLANFILATRKRSNQAGSVCLL